MCSLSSNDFEQILPPQPREREIVTKTQWCIRKLDGFWETLSPILDENNLTPAYGTC